MSADEREEVLDELAEQSRRGRRSCGFSARSPQTSRSSLRGQRKSFRWGAGAWAHPYLEGFLDSLAAWLEDSGRFDGLPAGAWRAFAEMLLAARVYE